MQGKGRSGNEAGHPLYDTPDWEYSDGRPAPVSARRQRRLQWAIDAEERIERLRQEMIELEQSEAARLRRPPLPEQAAPQ